MFWLRHPLRWLRVQWNYRKLYARMDHARQAQEAWDRWVHPEETRE